MWWQTIWNWMTLRGIWNRLQIQIHFKIACAEMPAARHTHFKLWHAKMTAFQMVNWKGGLTPPSSFRPIFTLFADSNSSTAMTSLTTYFLAWPGLPIIHHCENELKQFDKILPNPGHGSCCENMCFTLCSCAISFTGYFSVCFNICEHFFYDSHNLA